MCVGQLDANFVPTRCQLRSDAKREERAGDKARLPDVLSSSHAPPPHPGRGEHPGRHVAALQGLQAAEAQGPPARGLGSEEAGAAQPGEGVQTGTQDEDH